ncbi:Protein PLANT CADMIUM RESISTANCE like [Quillaja saponaria]|uniref:Protein PLANT CADMIUM RESISTANCE like n=1 Tax=Quillaja saponaria TaxID=32244 RepID=A0AAD7P9A9_QUISA|nr:Protein PLANT CADMIUM RESISTANCE like [Quillaja saponaria]
MGDLEKQEKMVEEEGKDEGEKERLLEGMAVLDFDMLCSTVALQTHGKWSNLGTVGDGEEGEEFGGVFRMWEGELFDCFDDHRVALESTWLVISMLDRTFQEILYPVQLEKLSLLPIWEEHETSWFWVFLYSGNRYISFLQLVSFSASLPLSSPSSHCYLYMAVAFTITVGTYLGFFRTQIRKKFNIKGTDSSLDDCVYHFICPCCTLCQESRTLEMNNVQDGTWHGRGDTICIGGFGEGSKAILDLHPPPHVSIKSIDHSGMQKNANASQP